MQNKMQNVTCFRVSLSPSSKTLTLTITNKSHWIIPSFTFYFGSQSHPIIPSFNPNNLLGSPTSANHTHSNHHLILRSSHHFHKSTLPCVIYVRCKIKCYVFQGVPLSLKQNTHPNH